MPTHIIAGRYRVQREVGRGGMGSVWLCRDERLGRSVAVKQVGGLPGESNLHLARALREARHSAALNHPNVVAIFDALEDGDHVWLVMEYVPSRTLDEMVREDGPLPPELAARIGADVADGLAAAHALGTVHRDVKPSNILVRETDGRALIADFGIARTVGQEQLTRSGLVTGTPGYFAPELARGEEPSPASDVWALGISLYVAVHGEPPYAEQVNAIALLNTIASQPPPEPTRAGPLSSTMQRMLDADPATRLTMAEVADELRALAVVPAPVPAAVPAAEDPVPAAEDPVPAAPLPAPVPVAEDPAPVAEDPGPVAEDPVPTPVRGERPPDTVATRVASAPDGRRRRSALLALLALALLAVVVGGGLWLTRDPTDEAADRPSAASGTSSPSDSRSPSGPRSSDSPPSSKPSATSTPSPSDTPPPKPTPTPTQTPTESPASPAGGGGSTGSPGELVTEYYGLLPDDTEAAWQLLTPGLQDKIGRGTFEGFWATIDDVSVQDTEDVGEGVVRVTLTYTTDGRSEQETRQLVVDSTDGDLLISEDDGAV